MPRIASQAYQDRPGASKRNIPERDIQKQVLELLERHPKVAWAKRMNSGSVLAHGTRIRFGFQGCPDILGQMKDGRILGIEVKRKGEGPNLAQQNQIALMQRANGVAGIVRSIDDLQALLA
jgi:hypothetical protein